MKAVCLDAMTLRTKSLETGCRFRSDAWVVYVYVSVYDYVARRKP